jgi:hypothetical protein
LSLCSPWIDGEDVAACCSVENTSGSIFDTVAAEASEMLFQLSGRQFPGECEKTVMPPCDPCSCGFQVLSRGFVVGPWYGWGNWGGWWGYDYCGSCMIGCDPSAVKLSGYPVQAVSEVKINGDILATDKYALRQQRYLVRLDDARWPWQNDLTLPDTEEGTWSVTYSYGEPVPELGRSAAAQLGCEFYKACVGQACALPTGVTRTTRQGVTIEKLAFTTWAYLPPSRIRGGRAPGWATGLTLVDSFLNTYNPTGRSKTPVFWSPGKRQYARKVG